MIEGVAHVLSTMRAASSVISRPLFWPWNSGSRMKTEIMRGAGRHDVVGW